MPPRAPLGVDTIARLYIIAHSHEEKLTDLGRRSVVPNEGVQIGRDVSHILQTRGREMKKDVVLLLMGTFWKCAKYFSVQVVGGDAPYLEEDVPTHGMHRVGGDTSSSVTQNQVGKR
jgi:hypothetical protein